MAGPPENGNFSLLRYAGLGIQMLAFIALFALIGYGLDRWTGLAKPWFLVGFMLLGCAGSIWFLIHSLFRK